MTNPIQWKPGEIIVNQEVRNDPDTAYFLSQCPGIPVKYVGSSESKVIVQASTILTNARSGMLNKVVAGKSVVFLGPGSGTVDEFKILVWCPLNR
jgi:hypothetical protein